MRQEELSIGEYYHVYNRGVDKRTVFRGKDDFKRFYASLYLFNNANYVHVPSTAKKIWSALRADLYDEVRELAGCRKPLVNVVSFNLRRNHFHLELEQEEENGISSFMHRVSMGYTNYFNLKNNRSGSLFEGTFKSKNITNQSYFEYLPTYIHLNTLDGMFPEWREGEIKDWKKAEIILSEYPWSSHGVYLGAPQSLPVVDERYQEWLYGTSKEYIDCLRTRSVVEVESALRADWK